MFYYTAAFTYGRKIYGTESQKGETSQKKKRILTQSYCKLQVYYMSTKTKFNIFYCNHMFHSPS